MQLPRQTTPYTCGAACLAAVGRMLGFSFDEMEIADACNAQPLIGIENAVLEAWARANLPVSDEAESSYPSIWNIRNPISGVGHYVVVLGVRAGRVRYYDPLWACVQEFALDAIDWRSGDNQHLRWRLDFKTTKSFFNVPLEGEPWRMVAAGKPIPEYALASLDKYLAKHVPVSHAYPVRRCPNGGTCVCQPDDYCSH